MTRQEHEGVNGELFFAGDTGHSAFSGWLTRGRHLDPENAVVVVEGKQKAGEGVRDSSVDDEKGDEDALEEEQDEPVADGMGDVERDVVGLINTRRPNTTRVVYLQ